MLDFGSQLTGYDTSPEDLVQPKRPKLSGRTESSPLAFNTSDAKRALVLGGYQYIPTGCSERYPLREKSDAQVLNSGHKVLASTLTSDKATKSKTQEKETTQLERRHRRQKRHRVSRPVQTTDTLRPDTSKLNMTAEELVEFVSFVNQNFRLKTVEEMNMVGATKVGAKSLEGSLAAAGGGACSDVASSSGPYNDENIEEPTTAADSNGVVSRSTRQQRAMVACTESGADGAGEVVEDVCKQFVPHKEKKGWVVCRPCGAPVWPPNCRKHAQQCRVED